jgi:hypothetical protein
MASKRRERMRAFRESGLLGSPTYSAILRTAGFMAVAALALGLAGLFEYSPSGNDAVYFGLSVFLVAFGMFVGAFSTKNYLAHRRAKVKRVEDDHGHSEGIEQAGRADHQ